MPLPFTAARMVLQRAVADRAFPAAVAEVGTATQPLWREAFGRLTFDPEAPVTREDTVFDLASLTKVLATTPLVMRDVERGVLALDDEIGRYLERWRRAGREGITIRDLLAHCSGLPAHVPYYRDLGDMAAGRSPSGAEARGEDGAAAARAAFEAAIAATALEYPPRSRSIYSDLGFMLLGFILAREAPLEARFDTFKAQTGSPEDLQFLPPEAWRRRIAPTQRDAASGRELAGDVHDENARALGGVAGHAGLFGTAAAVGDQARHVLQVLDGRSGAFARETLVAFVTRRDDIPGSSRALGWDTMLPTSSCGTRLSPRAFGHVGFTGTSLWIDPERGLYIVLLTNRVYPDSANDAIRRVRPAFHDAVVEEFEEGPI